MAMYGRIVTMQLQPGKADEASRIVRDAIVPAMKEQAIGFLSQLFLTDPGSNKAVSINIWETEADLTAFETSPLYRELLGKLGGLLAGPPAGERYEVAVRA